MIGRALDSNNDIIITGTSFQLVEGASEVLQHVRTRLLFYYGEWFLDTEAGIPYLNEVFTKPTDLAKIESIFKASILSTEGIESLTEFSMEYEGGSQRKLVVSFSAETIYGQITKSEVFVNV